MINNISHILLRAEKPLVEALTLSWKVPSPELSSEKSLDLGKLLKNVALTVSDTFRGFQWFLEANLVANGIWWQTSQLVMFVAVVSKFQMCSFKPKMRLKPLCLVVFSNSILTLPFWPCRQFPIPPVKRTNAFQKVLHSRDPTYTLCRRISSQYIRQQPRKWKEQPTPDSSTLLPTIHSIRAVP